jgi:hypothetical protein
MASVQADETKRLDDTSERNAVTHSTGRRRGITSSESLARAANESQGDLDDQGDRSRCESLEAGSWIRANPSMAEGGMSTAQAWHGSAARASADMGDDTPIRSLGRAKVWRPAWMPQGGFGGDGSA